MTESVATSDGFTEEDDQLDDATEVDNTELPALSSSPSSSSSSLESHEIVENSPHWYCICENPRMLLTRRCRFCWKTNVGNSASAAKAAHSASPSVNEDRLASTSTLHTMMKSLTNILKLSLDWTCYHHLKAKDDQDINSIGILTTFLFLKPVDRRDYSDYYEYITHPMDISTINKKLAAGLYLPYECGGTSCLRELGRSMGLAVLNIINDVQLIRRNAETYNTDSLSKDVCNLAASMTTFFETTLRVELRHWISSPSFFPEGDEVGRRELLRGLYILDMAQFMSSQDDIEALQYLDKHRVSGTNRGWLEEFQMGDEVGAVWHGDKTLDGVIYSAVVIEVRASGVSVLYQDGSFEHAIKPFYLRLVRRANSRQANEQDPTGESHDFYGVTNACRRFPKRNVNPSKIDVKPVPAITAVKVGRRPSQLCALQPENLGDEKTRQFSMKHIIAQEPQKKRKRAKIVLHDDVTPSKEKLSSGHSSLPQSVSTFVDQPLKRPMLSKEESTVEGAINSALAELSGTTDHRERMHKQPIHLQPTFRAVSKPVVEIEEDTIACRKALNASNAYHKFTPDANSISSSSWVRSALPVKACASTTPFLKPSVGVKVNDPLCDTEFRIKKKCRVAFGEAVIIPAALIAPLRNSSAEQALASRPVDDQESRPRGLGDWGIIIKKSATTSASTAPTNVSSVANNDTNHSSAIEALTFQRDAGSGRGTWGSGKLRTSMDLGTQAIDGIKGTSTSLELGELGRRTFAEARGWLPAVTTMPTHEHTVDDVLRSSQRRHEGLSRSKNAGPESLLPESKTDRPVIGMVAVDDIGWGDDTRVAEPVKRSSRDDTRPTAERLSDHDRNSNQKHSGKRESSFEPVPRLGQSLNSIEIISEPRSTSASLDHRRNSPLTVDDVLRSSQRRHEGLSRSKNAGPESLLPESKTDRPVIGMVAVDDIGWGDDTSVAEPVKRSSRDVGDRDNNSNQKHSGRRGSSFEPGMGPSRAKKASNVEFAKGTTRDRVVELAIGSRHIVGSEGGGWGDDVTVVPVARAPPRPKVKLTALPQGKSNRHSSLSETTQESGSLSKKRKQQSVGLSMGWGGNDVGDHPKTGHTFRVSDREEKCMVSALDLRDLAHDPSRSAAVDDGYNDRVHHRPPAQLVIAASESSTDCEQLLLRARLSRTAELEEGEIDAPVPLSEEDLLLDEILHAVLKEKLESTWGRTEPPPSSSQPCSDPGVRTKYSAHDIAGVVKRPEPSANIGRKVTFREDCEDWIVRAIGFWRPQIIKTVMGPQKSFSVKMIFGQLGARLPQIPEYPCALSAEEYVGAIVIELERDPDLFCVGGEGLLDTRFEKRRSKKQLRHQRQADERRTANISGGGRAGSSGAEDVTMQEIAAPIVITEARMGRGRTMTQPAWMNLAVIGLEGAGVDG
jgi:hypothetical protein